jgi:hypothetical protein
METRKLNHKFEHGQMIPIVLILFFLMIMMSALAVDAGALMTNKRTAQNVADAAALAGARYLCKNKSAGIEEICNGPVNDYIYTYNINKNAERISCGMGDGGGASGLIGDEIVVTVEVEHASFFARIFGQGMLTAQATAGAGCFSYLADVILPVAFPCNPPLPDSESTQCDYFTIDYDDIKSYVNYNKNSEYPSDILNEFFEEDGINERVYVVADTNLICGHDLICDFHEDGEGGGTGRHQLNSSERGWLNLEGGDSGTSTFTGWIYNGLDTDYGDHVWLSFIRGNRANPGFGALESRRYEIVWIPVFFGMCDSYPSEGKACYEAAHRAPFDKFHNCEVKLGSPAYPAAHVVYFAPFFTTCVRDFKTDYCPGYEYAMSLNPTELDEKDSSLEGYFIRNLPDEYFTGDEVGTGGADFGYYRAALTR